MKETQHNKDIESQVAKYDKRLGRCFIGVYAGAVGTIMAGSAWIAAMNSDSADYENSLPLSAVVTMASAGIGAACAAGAGHSMYRMDKLAEELHRRQMQNQKTK